jgi:uncharacterized protein YaiI (UPF0178 family)
MTIWVDADSCPVPVRLMIERFALRLKIPVVYAANRAIHPQISDDTENPLVTSAVTENVPGAADDYICDHIAPGDLAVTRDIPLAARLVDMGVTVLNDRGARWTHENIRERLSERDFKMALVEMGVSPEKTGVYGKREIAQFANALDKALSCLTKEPTNTTGPSAAVRRE